MTSGPKHTDCRRPGLVLRGALIGLGGRVALGVVQEFVLPKWTSRHGSEVQDTAP